MSVAELYRRIGWTGISVGLGGIAVVFALAATNDMPEWLRGTMHACCALLVVVGAIFKVNSRAMAVREAADRELFRILDRIDRRLAAIPIAADTVPLRAVGDRHRFWGSAPVVHRGPPLEAAPTPLPAGPVLDLEDARMIRRLDERYRRPEG